MWPKTLEAQRRANSGSRAARDAVASVRHETAVSSSAANTPAEAIDSVKFGSVHVQARPCRFQPIRRPRQSDPRERTMSRKTAELARELWNDDLVGARAALGLTISHCAVVLQSNRERIAAWERQPYWEPSPASDESLYYADEAVHEQLEYEGWVNEVWAAVLSMLNGAANLSKLFYGTGAKQGKVSHHEVWIERQRFALRNILSPGSALGAASRATRDAFEHIDERL